MTAHLCANSIFFKEFGIVFRDLAALTLEVCPTSVSPLNQGRLSSRLSYFGYSDHVQIWFQKIIHVA